MIPKIPLGDWVQAGILQLTSHFEHEFHFFSEHLSDSISHLIEALLTVSPLIIIVCFGAFSWLISRNWKAALGSVFGLLLIVNLGYWQETLETLALVLFSTLISVFFGVPLGIAAAHHRRVRQVLQPILDLMQTIPTFVFLIPTLMLFGLGLAPGIISTVTFAMPAVIRLTCLGVQSVPASLLEVSESFGATSWQKLIQVEIPYAWKNILTGISQCIMLSLSMVVVAALVGADGLGKPVVQALNTVNISKGFEAGVVIVIVAILLDRLLTVRGSSRSSQGTPSTQTAG